MRPPAPAPAPAPVQAFSPFGPLPVATSAATTAPEVARLAGGGNVVLWVAGDRLLARFTDAAGGLRGDPIVLAQGQERPVGTFAVAPAVDGGFVVTWALETERPQTQFQAVMALQARRFTADGALAWDRRIHDGLSHSIASPVVEPLPDGGFVVGWTAKAVLPAPAQGWLQRLAADGSRSGPVAALGGTGQPQEQLALAALPDGSVLAAWREVAFGSRGPGHWLYTRRFDAANVPAAPPQPITGFNGLPATQPFRLAAETLADGRVGLVWGGTSATGPDEVHVTVLAPDGQRATPVDTIAVDLTVSDVAVVPLGAGFGAAWQTVRGGSRQTSAYLWMRPYGADGAPTGAAATLNERLTQWVSPTTGFAIDVGLGFDLAGGVDGHVVGAYHQADGREGNTYLFGR